MFFGALNREADWKAIIPALNRILADRGDTLRIQVVHDWGFYDAIETEFKSFESFCAYDKYITLLRTRPTSPCFPSIPRPFNLCKSDLKFIESAAHGTVALASPTIYGDTIRAGQTGLIFESAEDFEEKLTHSKALGDVVPDRVEPLLLLDGERDALLSLFAEPFLIAFFDRLGERDDRLLRVERVSDQGDQVYQGGAALALDRVGLRRLVRLPDPVGGRPQRRDLEGGGEFLHLPVTQPRLVGAAVEDLDGFEFVLVISR